MAQEPPRIRTTEHIMDMRALGEEDRAPIHVPLSMGDEPIPFTHHTLNASLERDSTYNDKLRQESVQKQIDEKVGKVNMVIAKHRELKEISVIKAMDFIEELISSAGGEPRVNFLEVDRKLIKIATRMPMKSNLHPMIPEAKNNPRFHKFITQILISMEFVEAVRWTPTEFGALVLIELK